MTKHFPKGLYKFIHLQSVYKNISLVIVVQSLSHVWLFATPGTVAHQAPLPSTISRSLLKFMSVEWCYLTVSSSASPFSFCLQSFPALESFPVSHFLASGGQSIGASGSATVFLMNIQSWTLTSLHDYWKSCNFDFMELGWQSDVSAFEYTV